MQITFDKYKSLGYGTVSAGTFSRYAALAENSIRRRMLFRPFIVESDSPGSYNLNDPAYWAEQNQRGICEVIDLVFLQENPNSEAAKARRTINSFQNGDYSEDYGSPQFERDNSQAQSSGDPVSAVVMAFFTPAQTFKGVS